MGQSMQANRGQNPFGVRAFGLLVGVTQFDAADYATSPLPHAEHDVEDLKQVLTSRLGWNAGLVTDLKGPVTKDAVLKGFQEIRRQMLGASGPTLFLLYLSTHGQLYVDRAQRPDLVMLAKDTKLDDPYDRLESGLTRHGLATWVAEVPASQKVVIADICYSAAGPSAAELMPEGVFSGVDAALLGSSKKESYVRPNGRNSIFTECLLEILRQNEGEIEVFSTFTELARLVPKRAYSAVAREQHPFIKYEGGIIIIGVVGHVERPPRIATYEEIRALCHSRLKRALSEYGLSSDDGTGYVTRRLVEEQFDKFLASDGSQPAFTLVGPAGAGKSTLLAHLAERSSQKGFPVIWLGARGMNVVAEPKDLLKREFERLGEGALAASAWQSLRDPRPLLVFLDAINEWNGSSSDGRRLCSAWIDVAKDSHLRLVAACREHAWKEIGEGFGSAHTFAAKVIRPGEPPASATLYSFDDQELETALALYPAAQQLDARELVRQPLFLQMIGDAAQRTGDVVAGSVSYAAVFRRYLDFRVTGAALRLDRPPELIHRAISRVVEEMLRRRVESLEGTEFFSLASEAVGVALLDEGVFRRTGATVAPESQLLHEYMLSQVLPEDPFVDFPRFEELSEGYLAAYSAAVFRLCGIGDVRRVQEILQELRDRRRWYILREALAHLPDLGPYLDTYLALFAEHSFLFEPGIWEQLRHRVDRQFEFCMEAARLLFTEQIDIDWESKRWWEMGFDEFASTVVNQWESDSPGLLLHCIKCNPRVAVEMLVRTWLADKRTLRGGPVTISQVAGVFIRAAGQRYPDIVLSTIEDNVRSASASEQIQTTVEWLADRVPDAAVSFAERWLTEPRLQYLSTLILGCLPSAYAPIATELVRRFLASPGTTPDQAVWAIRVLGHFRSREVLEFVSEVIERSEYRSGALEALRSLYGDFAQEAEQLLDRSVRQAPLSVTDLRAAVKIYADVGKHSPERSLEFYRRVLGGHYALASQEIKREIARAISYWPSDGHTEHFVEQQLAAEEDANALRFYGRWVSEKVRKLGPADLTWLRRIVAAQQGSDLVRPILCSEIAIKDQVQLFVDMELCTSHYFVHGIPGGEILRLSRELLSHPQFGRFRPIAQCWFRRIAAGDEPDEARKHCVKEELRGN